MGNNHWKGIVKLGNLIRADDNGRAVVHFDGVSERPCRACPSHSLLPVMQLEVIAKKNCFSSAKGLDLWRYKRFLSFSDSIALLNLVEKHGEGDASFLFFCVFLFFLKCIVQFGTRIQ